MRNNLLKYIVSILFTWEVVFTEQVNTVYGNIYDSYTMKPIENVNILLENTDIGTASNVNGYFELNNIKEGFYILNISHIGYQDKTIQISFPMLNKLEISLKSINMLHQPVMVSGLHIEKPLSDSPIITEIITKNEIERFSSSNILELLEKSLPSIKIQNDSHGSNMSIQGLDSKYFLFLVDGNRMIGETTGNIDFSRLNTANIDRIEILNGGASTLYGSGAVGGVINIVTKNDISDIELNFKTKQYSKNNDQQNSISLGAYNKKYHITSITDLIQKSSRGYSINGYVIQNIYNDMTLNQTFKFYPLHNLKINLSTVYYSHDTEDYNYNNKRRDKYYDRQLIIGSEYKKNSSIVSLSWNYDKYDKYTLFTELNNDERIRSSHRLNVGKLNFSDIFNYKINYYFGLEYYNEEFYSPTNLDYDSGGNPFAGYLGQDSLSSYTINSFFGQIESFKNRNFQYIFGFRYDVNNAFGDHLGPHLSILYKTTKYRFRFNGSHNFKSPSLKELYMQWDHLGMFDVKGNKDLEPERSNYFSSSIEKYNKNKNITIKYYYHQIDNMIASIFETENDQMIYKNFQTVLINGIDMYIKARFSNSAISATISIIDSKDKTFNHQLEGSNKLSFNSSYIYFLKDDLSNININYRYISDTYYEDNNIPEYSIMNLSYNYKIFKKISISLGIDNLINTTAVINRMTMYPDRRYYFTISFNNK